MPTVQETINELKHQLAERRSKIEENIKKLQDEVSKAKEDINDLMHDLVAHELAGDSSGQASINKEVSLLKAKEEGLSVKIAAYQDVLNDNGISRADVVKVLDIAKRQEKNKNDAFNAKYQEIDQLQKQITSLNNKVQALKHETEFARMDLDRDRNDVNSLIKAIEKRPLKYGQERNYLEAFAQGFSIDNYLEKPKQDWIPPVQTFGQQETHEKTHSSTVKVHNLQNTEVHRI